MQLIKNIILILLIVSTTILFLTVSYADDRIKSLESSLNDANMYRDIYYERAIEYKAAQAAYLDSLTRMRSIIIVDTSNIITQQPTLTY